MGSCYRREEVREPRLGGRWDHKWVVSLMFVPHVCAMGELENFPWGQLCAKEKKRGEAGGCKNKK